MRAQIRYRILLLTVLTAVSAAAENVGEAGVYSSWFDGKTMANGDPVDQDELTAAAGSFALGSTVRVTNLDTDDSAVVRVTDRLGPKPGALIVVTRAAAQRLGFAEEAKANVRLDLVSSPVASGKARNGLRARVSKRRSPGALAPPGEKPSPFAFSRTILAKR